jgi:hypothetical protein
MRSILRLLVIGLATAGFASPVAAADLAGPPGCGIVTDPEIGRNGYVTVV